MGSLKGIIVSFSVNILLFTGELCGGPVPPPSAGCRYRGSERHLHWQCCLCEVLYRNTTAHTETQQCKTYFEKILHMRQFRVIMYSFPRGTVCEIGKKHNGILKMFECISLLMLNDCFFPSFRREYGTIDDVDIDLHINISFLDVSQHSSFPAHTSSFSPHYYSNVDILKSNTSCIMHRVLVIYLCNE